MPRRASRRPSAAASDAGQIVIRPATAADAAAAAGVWLRSFAAALPGVRRAHGDDEVRAWFRDVVVPQRETYVASGPAIIGVMVLHENWLDQLYLDPHWRGRGLGDRLIALAKGLRPAGLQLWTFQVNAPARRFYARHGFAEVELTDGAGNEEREPDVRLVWSGGQAVQSRP